MNRYTIGILTFLMPPLFIMSSCRSPKPSKNMKPASTELWKEQERLINDRLAAEEYKTNHQMRHVGTLKHVIGTPKKYG